VGWLIINATAVIKGNASGVFGKGGAVGEKRETGLDQKFLGGGEKSKKPCQQSKSK